MLYVRRFLATLVALSVAAMPAVSFAAAPERAAWAMQHTLNHSEMPDCDGMKAEHQKEHCPKCKSGACTPAACQLTCSNVVGDLPHQHKIMLPAPARLGFAASAIFDAIHPRPPLPPPRA